MYLISNDHSSGPGTHLIERVMLNPQKNGLGCACGGTCGHCGSVGLGLFDSGLDLTGWGPMEYIVAGVLGWGLVSMLTTGTRGVRAVRKGSRARKSKAKRKADLQKQLAAL